MMLIGGSELSGMLMQRIAAMYDRPRDQHWVTLGLQAGDSAQTESVRRCERRRDLRTDRTPGL